jgi:hypothetical protein
MVRRDLWRAADDLSIAAAPGGTDETIIRSTIIRRTCHRGHCRTLRPDTGRRRAADRDAVARI